LAHHIQPADDDGRPGLGPAGQSCAPIKTKTKTKEAKS
jgi:hypothetical protein